MGRISYDHICLGNFLHHPAGCHLTLQAFDPDHDNAPVVLAKGLDELALRIVKVGEENNVYTIENKPLARAMYNSCELDRSIPSEFYTAVAEILVYLYKQDNGKNKDRK